MKKPFFSSAIVRTPSSSMVNGITTAALGRPDYQLALVQHQAYIDALEFIGLNVTVLPAAEEFPDACFVEDVAVLTNEFAIICNPGADSRRGEKDLILSALTPSYKTIHHIDQGYIDGGDVMMVGNHFYVGLSERTNKAGFDQFADLLALHQCTASAVAMQDMLHLKTGLSYLEDGNLLCYGEFNKEHQFDNFNRLPVNESEAYAANSVWVNDTVLVPTGNPNLQAKVGELGYKTVALEMSEFRKLDGGLSCLSLRF